MDTPAPPRAGIADAIMARKHEEAKKQRRMMKRIKKLTRSRPRKK